MAETLGGLEAVVFPEPEWLIVSYLRTNLPLSGEDDVVVEVRDRWERPERFITTRLGGGSRAQLVIGEPIISVQVWPGATDDNGALANLAEALVYTMPSQWVADAWVRDVTGVGGVQFFPDPDSRLPRYQFTVQLNLSPHQRAPAGGGS